MVYIEYLCQGRYQSGQMGQTVNLLLRGFVGSNPTLPTVLKIAEVPIRINFHLGNLSGVS